MVSKMTHRELLRRLIHDDIDETVIKDFISLLDDLRYLTNKYQNLTDVDLSALKFEKISNIQNEIENIFLTNLKDAILAFVNSEKETTKQSIYREFKHINNQYISCCLTYLSDTKSEIYISGNKVYSLPQLVEEREKLKKRFNDLLDKISLDDAERMLYNKEKTYTDIPF